MMLITLLVACSAVVWGIMAIEKKRQHGTLTYPLWRCNFVTVWLLLAMLSAVLMSGFVLPRFVGLLLHGTQVQATVRAAVPPGHCRVSYSYRVQAVHYEDTDSMCGLKSGDTHDAYYDAGEPQNSTLYPPSQALTNESTALVFIALCLSALLVVWLRMTSVIGRKL